MPLPVTSAGIRTSEPAGPVEDFDTLLDDHPDAVVTHPKFADSGRGRCRHYDVVCSIRTDGIDPGLEPMKTDLVQVSRRCQQVIEAPLAPIHDFLLISIEIQLCPGRPASRQYQGR